MFQRRCALFSAIVVILLCGRARADVGPPVDVKISAVTIPAVSGQVYDGVFEISVFEPGTLAQVEVSGQGWDVQSVVGAADRSISVPGLLRIPFRALPADASQSIWIAFTFDGTRVRRKFEVSNTAVEATQFTRLATAVREPVLTPTPSSTEADGDGAVSSAQSGAVQVRVKGQVLYPRTGIDENDDGDFDDPDDTYPQLVGVDNVWFNVVDIDLGGAELMKNGQTDVDGKFDTGTFTWEDCNAGCEDPDIVVSFVLGTGAVNVKNSTTGNTIFAATVEHEDFEGGTLDLGIILISPGLAPAFHIFNSMVRTERFVRTNTAYDPPTVQVEWPDNSRSGGAWYQSGDAEIHISTQRQWREDTHAHEFGHHFLSSFSLTISPDYCNGICDAGFSESCGASACTAPGHCAWCEENEHDAWNEGWPNWLADVVTRSFSNDYTFDDGSAYQPLYLRDYEDARDCCIGNEFQDPLKTEGFVAMLLRDIEDENYDNHDDDEYRDSLCLGVDEIFDTVATYFPTNVEAFMNAFILAYPEHVDRLRHTAINVAPIYASVADFPPDTVPLDTVIVMISPSHGPGTNNALPCLEAKWQIPPDDVRGACEYSFLSSTSDTSPAPSEFANEVRTEGCGIIGSSAVGGVGDNYFHIKAKECGSSDFPDEFATFGPFEVFDCNSNGTVDVCDISCAWVGDVCWTGDWCGSQPECGHSSDCNDNKVPDECDIADGTSADCNNNGIPDECEDMGNWGGVNGSWHDGAMWKELTVPGDGYHICVEEVPEDVTAIYAEGTHNIASLSCSESLVVESRTYPAAHAYLTLNEGGFIRGDLSLREARNDVRLTTLDTLTIDGLLNLDRGKLNGPGIVLANGGLNVTRGTRVEDKVLEVLGPSESSDRILIGGGAVIHNNVGMTWDIVSDGGFINQTGGTLVNDGVIRKTIATGSSQISCAIENAGEFHIDAGTLEWSGTTTSTGAVIGAPGTVFGLVCGRKEFLPSSTIAVDGLQFTGGNCGTTNVRGTVNISSWLSDQSKSAITFTAEANIISYGPSLSTGNQINFEAPIGDTIHFDSLSGGTLRFNTLDPIEAETFTFTATFASTFFSDASLTVNQLFTFGPGTHLTGSGVVNVNGAMSVPPGSNQRSLDSKVMNIAGLCTMNGGFNMTGTAAVNILPTGKIDLAIDGGLINYGVTNNEGLVVKSGGAGTTTLGCDVFNAGTIEVQTGILKFGRLVTQTAGSLILNGGDVEVSGIFNLPLQIDGGLLTGHGAIDTPVPVRNDGGTVAPGLSVGTIVIDGDYVQNAGGTLEIEINGTQPDDFDLLDVTGTASLAGELQVVVAPGLVSAPGTSFAILTAAAVDGEFDTVVGPPGYDVRYGNQDVTLVVVSPADLDDDGDVELADWSFLQVCFGGSGFPPSPDCPPGIDADLDDDGDVDLDDLVLFLAAAGAGPS